MAFGVEYEFVQADHIWLRKRQVEVLEHFREVETAGTKLAPKMEAENCS